jgi:ketosteroid isomerase-like protein
MTTADVLQRFNDAFLRHEPALLDGLIADNCVIERARETAEGTHLRGGEACRAAWQALAADRRGVFTLEEVLVSGERGLIFWTYRHGDGPGNLSRGLNVMTVRGGQVVEGRGYLQVRLPAAGAA